ncbi:MAG TPA: alpha-amylase family glycosyl hydrolase [Rhizomicrobium sp.]
MTASPWWQGAVIYQIYIRSFCDANGDGQGDFAGLISKLDYLAALGVDAIWLSPIHPSPNRDWGYDVSDFDGIHPDYGTQADFDNVLAEAHARGMKVITDEVLAHTSDEHRWFRESLKRDSGKSDWYVWADPKIDGTVPNNWLSAFAGPAWAYQPARRQYYHHKFLRQQPKLNWRQPAAKAAALAVLDYWLKRGVDGFRLDVANAYLHDPALTDNPPVPLEQRNAHNWAHAPNLQFHYHDSNLPEEIEVLDEVRRTVDAYPNRFVMGEFSEEPERSGTFAASKEGLHSGYSFPLLEARTLGPDFIRDHFAMLARHPNHWPSVAFCNHDIMRTLTRFGGKNAPRGLAKMMLALLLTLKGTALIYQGEELGLPQADVRRDQLKDPVGDLYYPYTFGRDGCRTPMPWNSLAPNLGFGTGTPWLPVSPLHQPLAADIQQADEHSTLATARKFIAARRDNPVLRLGDIQFLDAPSPVLAFTRTYKDERAICVFNMSAAEATFTGAHGEAVDLCCGDAHSSGDELRLGPYAAWFGRL